MWSVVGELLNPAIGMVLSPLAVVGLLGILALPRALSLAPAFVAGWLAAIIVTVGLIAILFDPDSMFDLFEGPTTFYIVLHLMIGMLLILLAVNTWMQRSSSEGRGRAAGWAGSGDVQTAQGAFLQGIVFSGASPKNLLLNIGAGFTIVSGTFTTSQTVSAVVIFTVLASLSVIIPLALHLALPESAEARLAGIREWLTENGAVVVTVAMLVLGVHYLGRGLGGL